MDISVQTSSASSPTHAAAANAAAETAQDFEKLLEEQLAVQSSPPAGVSEESAHALLDSPESMYTMGDAETFHARWQRAGRLIETKNADGTRFIVSAKKQDGVRTFSLQLETPEGRKLTIDVSGNLRVSGTENGGYAVYFAESNTTRLYAGDGSFVETEGDTAPEGTQKTFICTPGSEVTGSDGDDVFLVLGNDTSIRCGAGNDKVVLPTQISGLNLDLGDGDNSVSGTLSNGANISFGNGNNRLEFTTFTGGEIKGGHGDNSLNISMLKGGNIILGNGNNALTLYEGLGGAQCRTMSFHESYETQSPYSNNYIEDLSNLSIVLGSGNNTLDAHYMYGGTVSMGNGRNAVQAHHVGNTQFALAGGNNTLTITHEMFDNSNISAGNGDNSVNVRGVVNSRIELGNGKNSLTVNHTRNAHLAAGNGNNTVYIGSLYGQSELLLGGGNNKVEIGMLSNKTTASFGNGNNAIFIWNMLSQSSLFAGDGNNAVRIGTMSEQATASLGNGRNDIVLADKTGTANIVTGRGGKNFSRVDQFDPADMKRLGFDVPPPIVNPVPDSELMARVGLLAAS